MGIFDNDFKNIAQNLANLSESFVNDQIEEEKRKALVNSEPIRADIAVMQKTFLKQITILEEQLSTVKSQLEETQKEAIEAKKRERFNKKVSIISIIFAFLSLLGSIVFFLIQSYL